jgi:hypothetical protein
MSETDLDPGSGESEAAEAEIRRRTRDLTAVQKQILAEKIYALLRADLRIERERLPLPHRLF